MEKHKNPIRKQIFHLFMCRTGICDEMAPQRVSQNVSAEPQESPFCNTKFTFGAFLKTRHHVDFA